MGIKKTAITLNELNKTLNELPDCGLKHELKAHIDEMCQEMLKQCLRRNQANNFRFHLQYASRSPQLDLVELDHYFVAKVAF